MCCQTPEQERLQAGTGGQRHGAGLLLGGNYQLRAAVQVRLHRSSVSRQPLRRGVQVEKA